MMDHSTSMMTQQQQQQQQQPQAQPQQVSATDQMVLVQQTDDANKRKQVKNACTNCQKACKKCDDNRPCTRCVKFGIAETCTSSIRKERKKGVKRGPYKRKGKQDGEQQERKSRKSSGSDSGSNTSEQQQHAAAAAAAPIYGQVTSATSTAQQGSIGYPYGFPPNLNQYHFLPYQYPYYGDDKPPQPGPYVMNYPPIYHYPMVIPGQQPPPPLPVASAAPAPGQEKDHQHPYTLPPPPPQSQTQTQTVAQPGDSSPDAIKKQQVAETQSSSDKALKKVKPESKSNKKKSKNQAKPQPMTPVPSSSSSATISSPESNQGDENDKNARLINCARQL